MSDPRGKAGAQGKDEGKMRYLVTMQFVDPERLPGLRRFLGMARTAALPAHEAPQLQVGENLGGRASRRGARYGVCCAGGFPQRAGFAVAGRAFVGDDRNG